MKEEYVGILLFCVISIYAEPVGWKNLDSPPGLEFILSNYNTEYNKQSPCRI